MSRFPAVVATIPPHIPAVHPPAAPADVAGWPGQTFPSIGQRCVGISPCAGWTLMFALDQDGDGFRTHRYFARSENGVEAHFNHSRFHFTPTQERFNHLARGGFTFGRGLPGPITDADIDCAVGTRDAIKVLAVLVLLGLPAAMFGPLALAGVVGL